MLQNFFQSQHLWRPPPSQFFSSRTDFYLKTSTSPLINTTIHNIIRWFTGSLGKMTRWPSVWRFKYYYFFFITFSKFSAKMVSFFYEDKEFSVPKCLKEIQEINAWKIKHLVDESFVHENQWPSISYCRLSDFKYLV